MDEIIPNLYIGEAVEALYDERTKTMVLIGVSEQIPAVKNGHHLPFLVPDEEGALRADIERLDEIATIIETALCADRKVLVLCGAGMERSPLAVTWYLHRYKRMTLDEAWYSVKNRRCIAKDCRNLLPGSYTAGVTP